MYDRADAKTCRLAYKINIRKELNFAINQSLKQMNITAETLYPGLDGLARSMSYPRSPLNDYKY